MCLHQITVTNNNNNNNNNMEDTHGTNLGRLPREPRLQPLLQPLLPAKATKRKRLNAVLDKLANNIKVAPESPDDDGDNNLEFEINVKTKIKKESDDPSSESEESDNERRNVELSDTDRSPRSSVSDIKDDVDSPNICLSPSHIKAEPEKSFSKNSNVFFNDSRQPSSNSPKESPLSQLRITPLPNQPSSPTPSMMSSYEQYIKSQLLSKMYLQQYMTNNLTKPYVLPHESPECPKTDSHSSKNNSHTKVISKDGSTHQAFLDGPLDLSTRQTDTLAIVAKDSLAQSIKERLYCQQFPFPPFPPMLMHNPALQSRSHDETPSSKIKQEPTAVVETSSTKKDPAYVCPICGQMFSLHDRLAKHMASRHKSKASDASSKAYFCDVCKRSFARSDMLTRHMRLHTGIKPYTCRVCGQVFSRSDHLSTHQRTHTGEKPYKCPSCPYSACRRDMITRHMRTHSRYELQDSSSIIPEDSDKEGASKNTNGEAFKFVKEEVLDS